MIKANAISYLVGLVVMTLSPVENLQAQTLKEALSRMLEFEPELNAAEYDTLSSREENKMARSALLPQISLDSSVGSVQRDRSTDGLFDSGDTLVQREAGISIRQLLYDGGVSGNEAKSSRNAHLAQQYLEKSMIESRTVDLAEVYLEVIRTQRQIKLAELNVRNHEQMCDMLQERVKAGGGRSDLALVQGRLGLALNTLATSRLSLRLASARFERLTGMLPMDLSFPNIPDIPLDVERIDLSNNYDFLAATEALKAAEHRAKSSDGNNRPRIYFDGGGSLGNDVGGVSGEDNEVRALVVASWDLFSGGRNKALKAREHFQVGKYEELLRTADIQRRYNLNNIWQERAGSLASVEALELYASELKRVTDDYREQFKVGRQELLNILDVQSESYTAQSQLLDASFDLDTSTFRVLGIQGQATSTILGENNSPANHAAPKAALPESPETIPAGLVDPDYRVPVTQRNLMDGQFDVAGPTAEYASPRHEYYEERSQLPFEPSVQTKRKGGISNFFRMTPHHSSNSKIFK